MLPCVIPNGMVLDFDDSVEQKDHHSLRVEPRSDLIGQGRIVGHFSKLPVYWRKIMGHWFLVSSGMAEKYRPRFVCGNAGRVSSVINFRSARRVISKQTSVFTARSSKSSMFFFSGNRTRSTISPVSIPAST